MRKFTAEERQEAIAFLRQYIRPGASIYMILRHITRGGTRVISFHAIDSTGYMRCLNRNIAKVTGYAESKSHEGVVNSVQGMDAGVDILHQCCRLIGVPFDEIRHQWL